MHVFGGLALLLRVGEVVFRRVNAAQFHETHGSLAQEQQRRWKDGVEVSLLVILVNRVQGVALVEDQRAMAGYAACRPMVTVISDSRWGQCHPIAKQPQSPTEVHV